MNAYDYLSKIRSKNPKLFTYQGEKKIVLPVGELERVIVNAFDSGRNVGIEEGKNSKSLFETIFG